MTKRLIEYNLPLADIFETPVESAFIALSRMQRTLKGLFQRPSALVPRDGLKPNKATVVDLKFICISMPPWPGDSEATYVKGKWQPTI